MRRFLTEVSLAEFEAAVRRMPKGKTPSGVKASIPIDTILSPDPLGVLVETPIMSSLVPATLPWPVVVSVDAWKLVALCDTHKKLRTTQTDRLVIGHENNSFFMMAGNTKLSLPVIR